MLSVQPSIVGLRSVEMFAQMSTSRLEELAPQFAWKRVAAGIWSRATRSTAKST